MLRVYGEGSQNHAHVVQGEISMAGVYTQREREREKERGRESEGIAVLIYIYMYIHARIHIYIYVDLVFRVECPVQFPLVAPSLRHAASDRGGPWITVRRPSFR